ncbi:MAG: asparagine synthetase B [Desulfobulbaceae bacterium]|nr:asparagine synthetase B [Desulfobulbaceae bacterium]
MSGLCGVFHGDDRPVEASELEGMVSAIGHRGPDGRGIWQKDNVGLGNVVLHTTPESLHEKLPLHDPESELTLVFDGRIDNREELIAALGIECSQGGVGIADSAIILAGYQKWREGCAEKFIGDFAFAVWDEKRRSLFCGRDHMGIKPFYYYWDGRLFVFASELKGIFALLDKKLGKKPEVNQERILDLLVFFHGDVEATFYKNIYRLPRASSLVLMADGVKVSSYWSFNPEKRIKFSSDQEYGEAFREIFMEAVRCRLRTSFPIGSTLSGGLDSSSITCVARDILQKSGTELHTFSAIFPGLRPDELKMVDERRYMDLVIEGGGIQPHFIHADKLSPLDFLYKNRHEEPMPAFNSYIHHGMYTKACDVGVRVFLDGLDGDTTVAYGADRLYDLGRYLRLPSLFREAEAYAENLGLRTSKKSVLKKYVLKPFCPDSLLKWYRICRGRRVVGELPNLQFLHDGIAASCNWQQRKGNFGVETTPLSSGRYKHYASLQTPLLQYVMELVDTVAGKLPMECRYPFWDRRLMEFCLALPMEQRLKNGVSRAIFRRAMHGIIPLEIERRMGKANLGPNFIRYMKKDAPVLLKKQLKSGSGLEDFVKAEKVIAEVGHFSSEKQTDNEGTLFYVLLALGVWLGAEEE